MQEVGSSSLPSSTINYLYVIIMIKPDKTFMTLAIDAAKQSAKNGDYAHGAVIIKDQKVISTGYETLKSANDPVNGHGRDRCY